MRETVIVRDVPERLVAAVNDAWEQQRGHVLVVTSDVELPAGLVDAASRLVEDDIRIATVSFLSDIPGLLHLGGPEAHPADADALAARLRSDPPMGPATVPFASGPVVLFSAYALSALGPIGGGAWAAAVTDFSLRARDRGFVDVVDPCVYLSTGHLSTGYLSTGYLDTGATGERPSRDAPAAGTRAAEVDELRREAESEGSPLDTVHSAARAKAFGLRVLIDGSCLGPLEMGTQVQTVALVEALALRPEVGQVVLALGSEPPAYAKGVIDLAKVSATVVSGSDLSGLGHLDIGHQPFQPDGPLDVASFAGVATRSLVTLLDLIAYQVRSYHLSAESWVAYRHRVRRAAADADGIVVPSAEVGTHLQLERLVPDDDRLFTIELGTDHLRGEEVGTVPQALSASPSASEPFVLVLGANYTHKNRDIAARVVPELRRRGIGLPVVMAGAPILDPARSRGAVLGEDDAVWVIPDVTSEERNWLLRHAALVLYPSSAEGFGFVPFEAARFGTPTVLVPVGPLRWFAGLPVVAEDWSVPALSDACEQLLADHALAASQVDAVMKIGNRLTWDTTAARLVKVYRSLLDRPARAATARLAAGSILLGAGAATQDELVRLRAENEDLRRTHEALSGSTAVRAATRLSAIRRSVMGSVDRRKR